MLTLYSWKPRFQRSLRPLARSLAAVGATANQVTIATCAASIALGWSLAFQATQRTWLLLLPAFFIIRMALNAIDGILARDFGQKSNLGAYLNELGDILSDAFLYLPFAYLPGFDPFWIGAVIVLSVISEMAGVVATTTGAGRRYDGPMGKSDRALVFGAVALWIGAGWKFASWAALLFPKALVLLLALTIVNRVRGGLAEIKSCEP